MIGLIVTGHGQFASGMTEALKVIQGNEEQLAKMTEEDIRTILSIGE